MKPVAEERQDLLATLRKSSLERDDSKEMRTYKDEKGNWLYPDEIEKANSTTAFRKIDKSKVTIGPPESMSKSKKNTIDPEIMIEKYDSC